ncbi:hypothetical protein, partial [Psychromonas sp. Urea-02u-13]|uniref:hypothetical protein n=1 Tax=Psychromonas sp. Urea-02u-13 TaxID=2058326 RepID=UPI001E2F81E1
MSKLNFCYWFLRVLCVTKWLRGHVIFNIKESTPQKKGLRRINRQRKPVSNYNAFAVAVFACFVLFIY